MCAVASTSGSSRFSVISSHQYGEVSQAVSRCLFVVHLLIFVLGFQGIASVSDASSSLRTPAGLEEVLDESCGGDAEDELAPELDDNPGTTTGTKFSVLHRILFPSLVRCGF